MCFINPITQSILEEEGLSNLIPTTCYGNPCVAYKDLIGGVEHIHNMSGTTVASLLVMDYLDYDLLLKLTGKSN